jgi:hypothetical protein
VDYSKTRNSRRLDTLSNVTNRPANQCQFSTPVGLYCERAIHRVQAAEYDQHVVALNVLLLMPA